ncbi:hypothetical protein KEJ45_04830 [Candidatus Bathyarchaeota archaeon]|nr:hypothetical protein [Candidatus Bathyarchaeota archaeon]
MRKREVSTQLATAISQVEKGLAHLNNYNIKIAALTLNQALQTLLQLQNSLINPKNMAKLKVQEKLKQVSMRQRYLATT